MTATYFGSSPVVRWVAAVGACIPVVIHVGLTKNMHERLFASSLDAGAKVGFSVCFNITSVVLIASAVVLVRTALGKRNRTWERATAISYLSWSAMFVVPSLKLLDARRVAGMYPLWILAGLGILAWSISRSP